MSVTRKIANYAKNKGKEVNFGRVKEGTGEVINAMGGKIGTAMTIGSGLIDYNFNRSEGQGVVQSAVGATATAAMWEMLGWKKMLIGGAVIGAANLAVDAGIQANEKARQYAKSGTGSPFSTSTFIDSEQTYTMRQAGLTQIQRNQQNMKTAVMGNEAMYMHR